VDVKVLDLPDGEDPDSLLRAGRKGDFERAIKEPLALAEFQLRKLIRRGPVETEDDRLALLSKARAIAAAVPNVIEQERYIRILAPFHPQFSSGSKYAEQQIRDELARMRAGAGAGYRFGKPAPDDPGSPVGRPRTAIEKAERHLILALIGEQAGLAARVVGGIAPDEFCTKEGRALAAELYRLGAGRPDREIRSLLAGISDEPLRSRLAEIALEPLREPLNERLIADEIDRLKLNRKRELLSDISAQIQRGDLDADTLRRLVPQFHSLQSDVSK
jgi:DNA primase